VEDGHVDIANEIAEALARTYLSSAESRILWAILRKTYGWHKKTDRISYSQLEDMTSMDRRHIAPALKRLISRQIITQTGNGQKLQYGLQKNYQNWQTITDTGNDRHEPLPKQVTSVTITQTGNTPLPIQVTEPLPKQVNTKEKKETIQKKNIYIPMKQKFGEFLNVMLTGEEYRKLVDKFGERGADDWIGSLSEWLKSTGKRRTDHYATILTWARREQKGGKGGKLPTSYKTPEEHRRQAQRT
jgi:phage replication O-like protein O